MTTEVRAVPPLVRVALSIVIGGAIAVYVTLSHELVGYGSLRATAGLTLFLGFILVRTRGAGMQVAYFVGVSPLLVFLEEGQRPFQLNEVLRLLNAGRADVPRPSGGQPATAIQAAVGQYQLASRAASPVDCRLSHFT